MMILACESDRSTGGGGVKTFGATDSGIPNNNSGDGGSSDTGQHDGSVVGGDHSGVDPAKFVDQLTPSEVMTICTWSTEKQGGPGMKMCGQNTNITVATPEQCTMNFSMGAPHCSVMSLEDCMLSLQGDACNFLTSAECAAYVQCATSQPPPDAGTGG